MIRSLGRAQTVKNADIFVCSLSWHDHPGQARLLPAEIHTEDELDVPLRHVTHLPLSRDRLDDGNSIPSCINSIKHTVDDGLIKARGKTSFIVNPRVALCAHCEDRAECSYTPDPPAVSPCSSSLSSSEEAASGSNSPVADDMLLETISSRMPCIETGQSIMMAWTDVREIFFPRCSTPDCNIVLSALKLQLKYPHIPQYMHMCSESEQMTFLKRHLHLVTLGTFLVDVEAFLSHRESLHLMVKTKHLVTTDTRSMGCSYAQQTYLQQDDWKKLTILDQKQKPNCHLLPAVVTPSDTGSMPGDASTPQDAMVPLTMLPILFPSHHRQLLLMATGFITGKDKRTTRRCSNDEARLLNTWHRSIKGSSSQLVTASDLLVKWMDVIVIVDPLAKHAARVCTSHQQQHQQDRNHEARVCSSYSRTNAIAKYKTQPSALSGLTVTEEVVAHQEIKEESTADATAEKWMPKILNCYSTSDTSPTEPMCHNAEQMLGEQEEIAFHAKDIGFITAEEQSKNNGTPTFIDHVTDKVQTETEIPFPGAVCSTSSSSCDSYCDIKPGVKEFDTCTNVVGQERNKVKKAEESTESEERLESSDNRKTKSVRKTHTFQTKPRMCKMVKPRARRSERIAKQMKESDTSITDESDSEDAISTVSSDETLIVKERHQSKCPGIADKAEHNTILTNVQSDNTCVKCGQERNSSVATDLEVNSGSEQKHPVHGFRSIADLFSVLSNEEVSHRSKHLASGEIADAMKKATSSKPRTLGDLSNKGLDFCSKSEVKFPIQKPQAGCSTKTSHREESSVPQVTGKNRNQYPELVIEAEKCPVRTSVPDPSKQQFSKQNHVSVTDIMKSMDKTFNAYKSDTVELIKAKMRAPENPTGYVNTDYIEIINSREKNDRRKTRILPPIDRYNDDTLGKRKVSLTSADISTILKSQDPKQNYSILTPMSASPHQVPVSKIPTSNSADTVALDTVSTDKQSTSNSLGEKDHNSVYQALLLPRKSRSPKKISPSRPHWNVNKVLHTTASGPKSVLRCKISERRKSKMDADFQSMKAKAIGKTETPVSKSSKQNKIVQEALKQGGQTSLSTAKTTTNKNKNEEKSVSLDTSSKPQDSPAVTNVNHTPLEQSKSKNASTKSEKVLQSKKRQRLEDTTERKSQQTALKEPTNSDITAYWSGFPVGQSKDCLANYRYGKSRYPIDYYTPPAKASTRRSKRNQLCNPPAQTNPLIKNCNAENDSVPSYITWEGRSPLSVASVRLHVGKSLILSSGNQQSHIDTESRERLLHSRSLSTDRCHFIIQDNGRPLPTVTGVRSFIKDLRKRNNFSTDTGSYDLNSALCDHDNIEALNVNVPSFHKSVKEERSVTDQVDTHDACKLKANENTLNFLATPCEIETIDTFAVSSDPDGVSCPQKSKEIQRYITKTEVVGRPDVARGPFHEIARLEAGGNSHNIRHLAELSMKSNGNKNTKRDQTERKNMDPLELPNGECMIWSEAKKMWFIDRNKNNNHNCCLTAETETTRGIQTSSTKTGENRDAINPIVTSRQDRGASQENLVICNKVKVNDGLTDIEDLLSNTLSSVWILRKCLSSTNSGANTNNNCKDDQLDGNTAERNTDHDRIIPIADVDSSSSTSSCKIDAHQKVNIGLTQPIYPSYGAMIKDEPIKKNVLLRETLKNNFFLIKEISMCVCTCRNVTMFSKSGEKMHYKKFLRKQYLQSANHCPLHAGESVERHRHEMLSLFECLSLLRQQKETGCESGKDKTKRKRNRKRKGRCKPKTQSDDTKCSWFSEREPSQRNSKSVSNQCLLSAAKEYLASYVNQHFKKELMSKYQWEERDATEGDHLFTDFFTFMEKFPHKAGVHVRGRATRRGSRAGDTNRNSATRGVDDRQLKRQLRGKGNAVTQQELFMQILKKTQCQRKSSSLENGSARSSDERLTDSAKQEGSSGEELCKRSGKKEVQSEKNKTYDQSDCTMSSCAGIFTTEDTAPATSVITSLWRGEQTDISVDDFSCDELFSNDHPDVSYHGMAYISGLALPYVVHNGYKYLPVKQAMRLTPRCCCSVIRSVLKKHSSLNRTLCTWEQVALLDSLSARKNRTIIRTGDVLIRLDTLIASLPAIDALLKIRHEECRPKISTKCLY